MNTKYGWIKHFHSSHYYLISCLTELSVWSNPWGFTTTRTGIIMTSGLLLRKYSKPEKSHRYFPSSFVWSISASTLSINKSLFMHPACCAACYGKHFKKREICLNFWPANDDILGWFGFSMPVVNAAVLRVIPGLVLVVNFTCYPRVCPALPQGAPTSSHTPAEWLLKLTGGFQFPTVANVEISFFFSLSPCPSVFICMSVLWWTGNLAQCQTGCVVALCDPA